MYAQSAADQTRNTARTLPASSNGCVESQDCKVGCSWRQHER